MRNSEVVIILKDIFRQLNSHIVKYSVKFIISIHRQEPIKERFEFYGVSVGLIVPTENK